MSANRRFAFVVVGLIAVGSLIRTADAAAPTAKTPATESTARPPSPIVPRSNVLTADPWNGVPIAPLSSAEIDKLLANELREDHIKPAARTDDEAFIRRVSLDLVGRLPTNQELNEFLRDRESEKRSKLIDKLLAGDGYATHWAKYWRDVISAKYTDRRQLAMVPEFEKWLTAEFRKNASWRDIARAMLTAEGGVAIGPGNAANSESTKKYVSNGAAVFLLAHLGQDQAEERAAETSRVFLGIQIQCAQCHDHPFDEWKQSQFHELAGYFARLRSRPMLGQQANGGRPRIELFSAPFGEHRLPDKSDPTKGTPVASKFLTGVSPRRGLSDEERRAALADEITRPEDFWFAAAFVNRMWGELMGQAFAQPVDDMGPGKDVYLPAVLKRLSASFRATDYDLKQLLRTICNSQAYQRQIRPGTSGDEHLHFAAAYPTRLRAEALWQSLVNVLGSFGPPMDPRIAVAAAFGANRRSLPLEFAVQSEFRYDPSLKADEVEGTIPQALLLMNNRDLNRAVRVRPSNALGQILKEHPKDEDAVRALYHKTLTRKPSDHELSKAVTYIHKVGKRDEAFEDLLWVLINSTEFQTKR
ncbi:MAG TPA: DUF1549 domain-containing protein [Gemmataceae bacterium]|nr:DUF1549 domain-containing protein [Gemmataceae bacterium]